MNIADETFVAADRASVAAAVADADRWRAWWPDLALEVVRDRGPAGLEWAVSGAWSGRLEIWLEPFADGVVLHHLVRADPAANDRSARWWRRRTQAWKRAVHALKDELEAGRAPGEGAVPGVKDTARGAD